MRIETISERTPLDKTDYNIEETTGEIAEASELLYEVINHSYICSGNCLETKINERNYDLQGIYWDCRQMLTNIQKGGSKTDFLAISVLENTFKRALPLLLVNVEEIANGDMTQPKAVNKLKEIFANSETKAEWKKKAELYKNVIKTMGFTLEYSDYDDLTLVTDPLLDAFTLYKGKNNHYAPKIIKVRDGERSSKSPVIMTTVCKYASQKEFVDALMQCEEEAIIAFGGVEKTERQTTDYFYEYIKGFKEERIRNIAKNTVTTEEETLDKVNPSSRAVYLGVKSKECCYIMTMPFEQDNYKHFEDSSCNYVYGRRAGYAPYQIFFNDITAAPEGTTHLATKHTGFRLNELMDDQQKIWFPAFIEETKEMFFSDKEVNAQWNYIPEEVYVKVGNTEITPVFNYLPATKISVFEIKEPEELFADKPAIRTLIKRFQIKKEDICDAPFIPSSFMTEDEVIKTLDERAISAYEKILAERVAEYIKCKWDTREKLVKYVFQNPNTVIERAKTGLFKDFMEVHIDKEPLFDKDGNPVMEYKSRYWQYATGEQKEQKLGSTEANDAKEYRYSELKEILFKMVLWDGEKTSSKPPVVVEIRPWKKEHYAALLGCKTEELDEILQLAEELTYFHQNRKNKTTNYNFIRKEHDQNEPSTYMPRLADINICMKKSVWKKNWN